MESQVIGRGDYISGYVEERVAVDMVEGRLYQWIWWRGECSSGYGGGEIISVDMVEESLAVDMVEESLTVDMVEESLAVDMVDESLTVDMVESLALDIVERESLAVDMVERRV